MGQKIVVGPITKGLKTNVTPFNIDNDSFPTLINAYQWRGRVKRKRGTSKLGRLTRFFNSTISSYTGTTTNPSFTITFDGSGNANLFGPYTNITPSSFSLQSNGNIIPGSVTITASGGPTIYTDPTEDGFLTPTGTDGPNTINYATGAILIPAQAGNTATTSFLYYPDLPVMGLEDFVFDINQFPGTIAFDTTYSYNILQSSPYSIYDVSFYKNPPTGTYVGYTHKTEITPTSWNGQNYQQFWTTNYQGAMWTTNGITVPFDPTHIGMQFAGPGTTPTLTAAVRLTATTMQFTIVGNPLVVGDFVFANEFTASAGGNADTLNFQTGFVTTAGNVFIVTFPNANITAGNYSPGILQYLTNRSDKTKDNIRWYDGDPTDGNATTPTLDGNLGWVNFMPPLMQSNFSIGDLPPAIYYLVGCRMILPYKDRLLFIGPVVQTSAGNAAAIYLQDTVVYSQNGTPYYTASFDGSVPGAVTSAATEYKPILVPTNQIATPNAYFSDSTGFGGFVTVGIDQPILTASPNEDVIIMGFPNFQIRFVYTGNDVVPFNSFVISSEYGSGSTFSIINMGYGVITRGIRGYVFSKQTGVDRIDLEIPDQVFEISLDNNGSERFCAQRDYIDEWIYFSYTSNQFLDIFPNQTLQYNYRDNSWGLFFETYTTYGLFRKKTGYTWATIGDVFPTWAEWNEPWEDGLSTLLQSLVIAGNQQGFVMIRNQGTGEGNSLYIQSFSGNTITSPNHGLNEDDFIVINGSLGTIGDEVNGEIFQISNVSISTFNINKDPIVSGTYFGGGMIKRMYIPFIQSKQFPLAWDMSRKTRLGPQQYLLTTTQNSQITLMIFLSQNGDSAYNNGPIVPNPTSTNNGLIYNTILYTCPESTNLGLTPSNINLNMVTAEQQNQIWHRVNTSLLGDTIQVGFTISPAQMTQVDIFGTPVDITDITKSDPCVITCDNEFDVGQNVLVRDVVGMIELNGNVYEVLAASSTTITIGVDSSGFTTYDSGGTVVEVGSINGFAEVELHGFILDASPSMVLA